MSDVPANLKYTSDHEWARVEGKKVAVGVTAFAQNQLGDVVFVELPAVGAQLKKGESFGTIESVKAVSELFAPVSGTVTKVNTALTDAPETVNSDSYGAAWLVEIEVSDSKDLDALMDAAAYEKHLAAEAK